MWAARMVHESSLHAGGNGNCFITLTYDDEHIPQDWGLKRDDFQRFMKRLRKRIEKPKEADAKRSAITTEPNERIKYYHCGEYGKVCRHGLDLELVECPFCNLGRPHYHACLFNLSFLDLETYAVQKGVVRRTSSELEKLWQKGFVDVGEVTVQSAAYVARYVIKKITGPQAEDHYQTIDEKTGEVIPLEAEYSTMSNGIGRDWYEQFKGDVYPSNELPVPGVGVLKKIPRYYDEILKTEDESLHAKIKEERIKFAVDHPERYDAQMLRSRFLVKKAQAKQLERNL